MTIYLAGSIIVYYVFDFIKFYFFNIFNRCWITSRYVFLLFQSFFKVLLYISSFLSMSKRLSFKLSGYNLLIPLLKSTFCLATTFWWFIQYKLYDIIWYCIQFCPTSCKNLYWQVQMLAPFWFLNLLELFLFSYSLRNFVVDVGNTLFYVSLSRCCVPLFIKLIPSTKDIVNNK